MIKKEELVKVAHLARISVTEEELAKYQEQLSKAMEYFEMIEKIDTSGVEPLVTPTDMEQHLRPDKMENWEGREQALENAPEKSGNLYKVPPVV